MPISSPYHEYYQHNPFEASAYIQDKIEFKEMIINPGIRFDFFDSDGRILTDPSDPQIYNPFNPNHIYSNYTSDLPDSLLIEATVEEREEYWYKDAETKKQISPRIGISFPITDRGVIHFSYGHFFQTPALSYLYRNPEFEVYGAGTEQYIGNADLDAERTVMYEVGIQQAISRDVTLHATAFYRDIRDWVGMSPPIDTYSARTTYQKYINKDYASVQGVTITTRYDADVFTAKLDYTFMEARGTTSDPLDAYYDAQDDRAPRVQMVILDWDQAHTANFFIANRIQNWSASCIVRLNSGLPYTPTYPRGEKFGSSSFVGLTENIGRRPYTFNIDLRFIKSWKIEGIRYELAIDVTNVLDSRTARNVYSDSGRPDFTRDSVLDTYNYRIVEISNVDEYFRRPGNFYPPRRIQLGFSIGF
ncbi:MAG: TonB-dependent receptor [FCB group bacterium]|nr:TonB-dependent receptor [FCB group bacterium]